MAVPEPSDFPLPAIEIGIGEFGAIEIKQGRSNSVQRDRDGELVLGYGVLYRGGWERGIQEPINVSHADERFWPLDLGRFEGLDCGHEVQ